MRKRFDQLRVIATYGDSSAFSPVIRHLPLTCLRTKQQCRGELRTLRDAHVHFHRSSRRKEALIAFGFRISDFGCFSSSLVTSAATGTRPSPAVCCSRAPTRRDSPVHATRRTAPPAGAHAFAARRAADKRPCPGKPTPPETAPPCPRCPQTVPAAAPRCRPAGPLRPCHKP